MRSRIAVVLICGVAAVALPLHAQAEPFSDNFDGLETALETEAGQLDSGPESKETKRKDKAVAKSRAFLLRDSDDYRGDAKIAKRVLGKLFRPYKAEFQADPLAMGSVPEQLELCLDGLATDVFVAVRDAQDVADALPDGKKKKKAVRALTKANDAVGDFYGAATVKRRARLALKAASLLARGQKAVVKAGGVLPDPDDEDPVDPGDPNGSTLSATIQRLGEFEAVGVETVYSRERAVLTIEARAAPVGDQARTIALTISGAGSDRGVEATRVAYAENLRAVFVGEAPNLEATVTIIEFALDRDVIRGTFTATGLRRGESDDLRSLTSGEFELHGIIVR